MTVETMPYPVKVEIHEFDPDLACPKCTSPPRYSYHPCAQSGCVCADRHHYDGIHAATRWRGDEHRRATEHLHAWCSMCVFYLGVFRPADWVAPSDTAPETMEAP